MKNDILEKIKSDYEEKAIARNKLERELDIIQSRINVMEAHLAVQKYLKFKIEYNELLSKFSWLLENDNCLLIQTADEYRNLGLLNDTNNVLFYRGSFYTDYSKTRIGRGTQCLRYDSNSEYDLYIDIESMKTIKNPTDNRDNFESKNSVIIVNAFPSEKDFMKTRTTFLETAIKEGQEIATKKVLSRK